MKPHKLLLLALACTWAAGASAQWQWTDAHGRKVFSDRPPPQDIPEKNILKQPHFAQRTAPPAPAEAAPAEASDTADKPTAAQPPAASGKDAQLEKNKAKAEAAEAAKKQAEEKAQAEKQAKTKADNCARAQQAKATLESGRMLSNINAKGERGFMDEATRKAELDRAQKIIDSDCKS
jgi:hypothetical protein